MEAKIKAKELVSKYYEEMQFSEFVNEIDASKQCAIIAVDEIIKEHCHNSEHKNPIEQEKWITYWQEVKREIELL